MGLFVGLACNMPIFYFAFFVLAGGVLLLLVHLHKYLKLGFSFALPDKETWTQFGVIMVKFLPCLFTMSTMEINLFVDNILTSYLPAGSLTLLTYACGFLRIPLGCLGVAFSTILLSHFSCISIHQPKRLSFYLLESTKFILWLTLPATLLMSFFSHKFFAIIFHDKFTLSQVAQASLLLNVLLTGLFFLSLNKIYVNIYYSLHETFLPGSCCRGWYFLYRQC